MSEVLVGIDPRELSVPALVWAADEAVRRASRLRLVVAVPPVHDRPRHGAVAHQSSLRIRAESALVNAEDLVRELHEGLWTATDLADGGPPPPCCSTGHGVPHSPWWAHGASAGSPKSSARAR
ncbi:hypothetical protein [Streptomyces wedmorensis]|uniref:hypothetical protein n=1 Tax=Streptomyces wedmorensis TaxID=43759 RepID=UPI0037A18382